MKNMVSNTTYICILDMSYLWRIWYPILRISVSWIYPTCKEYGIQYYVYRYPGYILPMKNMVSNTTYICILDISYLWRIWYPILHIYVSWIYPTYEEYGIQYYVYLYPGWIMTLWLEKVPHTRPVSCDGQHTHLCQSGNSGRGAGT